MKTITDKELEGILDIPDKLIVIKFGAEWCPPCKALAPIMDTVATTIESLPNLYEDKIIMGSIDVDANPISSTKYGIRSIPAILFIKNGEVLEKLVGLQTEAYLLLKIDQNLGLYEKI